MKDWKHATQQEIDNMTFEEAVEIVQKQIDMGEKKVGDGDEWCARAHTTHAYQMILDNAKAKTTRDVEIRSLLSDTSKRCKEIYYLRQSLRTILNIIIRERLGGINVDCAYSNICDIISGMENYLYGGDETE